MGGEKLRILETRKFYSTFTSHEARPARRHSSRERESTIWGGGARTAHSQRLTSFNFIKFHAPFLSPVLSYYLIILLAILLRWKLLVKMYRKLSTV